MLKELSQIRDRIKSIKGWSRQHYHSPTRVIQSRNVSVCYYSNGTLCLRSKPYLYRDADLCIEFDKDGKCTGIEEFNWNLGRYGDWQVISLEKIPHALSRLDRDLKYLINEQIKLRSEPQVKFPNPIYEAYKYL